MKEAFIELIQQNILNDYDGVRHNYTRKGGLVWQEVFLPDNAPAERTAIRAEHRENITQRLQGTYGKHYHPELLRKAERMIATELGEQPAAEERDSLREQLNTRKQTQEHHPDQKEHDHARGR